MRPIDYVMDKNLRRRQLPPGQAAAAAAEAIPFLKEIMDTKPSAKATEAALGTDDLDQRVPDTDKTYEPGTPPAEKPAKTKTAKSPKRAKTREVAACCVRGEPAL